MNDSNNREFTRVPSGMEVDLKFYDGTEISGFLDNISLRGLFLPTDHQARVGSACEVRVHLGGRDRGFTLEINGVVTRCEDGGVGVRFDEITYEAFQHLQKIVMFSSSDPERIESEMDTHLGLHPRD